MNVPWFILAAFSAAMPVAAAAAAPPPATRPSAPLDPTPYPDLSSPKAALCSFGAALVAGDAETAQAIYSGRDPLVLALIEGLAAYKAATDRLASAATARFGKNAASLALRYHEPSVHPRGEIEAAPLTDWFARLTIVESGDTASAALNPQRRWVAKLRRAGGEWRIVELEVSSLTGWLLAWRELPVRAAASDKVAAAVEAGRYRHVHEVHLALQKALVDADEELFGPAEGRPPRLGAATAPATAPATRPAVTAAELAAYADAMVCVAATLDAERLDVDALARWLREALDAGGLPADAADAARERLADVAEAAGDKVAGFREVGGRHVHYLMSEPNIADSGCFLVIPADRPRSEELLYLWLRMNFETEPRRGRDNRWEREGAVVWYAAWTQMQRTARDRPEAATLRRMDEAWRAAGDAPLRGAFWQNAWVSPPHRLIDWCVPELEGSKELFDHLTWLAVSLELRPEPRLRLVMRGRDPDGAKAAAAWCVERVRALAGPDRVGAGARPVPKVEGDTATLELGGDDLKAVLRPKLRRLLSDAKPR